MNRNNPTSWIMEEKLPPMASRLSFATSSCALVAFSSSRAAASASCHDNPMYQVTRRLPRKPGDPEWTVNEIKFRVFCRVSKVTDQQSDAANAACAKTSLALAEAASSRAAAASERSAAAAARTAWWNAFCAAAGELPPLADALATCTAAVLLASVHTGLRAAAARASGSLVQVL